MKSKNKMSEQATEVAEPTKPKSEVAERGKAATGVQVVRLAPETVEELASAMLSGLVPALILHSRLCAADTVRTTERPDTVFRHAIKEARIARTEIDKYCQATNA